MSREPIGTYQYEKWGGTCSVQVFLLKIEQVLDAWPESSVRQRRWSAVDEAANLVEEEELAKIIRNLPRHAGTEDLFSEN